MDVSDLDDYLEGGSEEYIDNPQLSEGLISTHTNGIEGLPYQFMSSVDRRIPGTDVGAKYAEKIFARMPLLFLSPCEPKFMGDYISKNKKGDVNVLINALAGNIESQGVGEILQGNGKYYSVELAYAEYFRILNTMLGCISVFMGIYKERIRIGNKQSVPIGQINWQDELNSDFKSYFSAKENLVFYLDSFDSMSQSFSNETTESSLAGVINGLSDQVNELTFLFGNNSRSLAGQLRNVGEKTLSNLSAGLSSAGEQLAGGIIGSIARNSPMLKGGKIVFPKIWSNSSFDQSYQLDIKLRSPDHDNLSIFLNIIKPFCKLLAMTLPRSMDNEDPNSYRSPLLVRANSKGRFSIDMGIISSLSVQKGDRCCWNDDGLPTQLDISITIDDLYSSLHTNALGSSNKVKAFGKLQLHRTDAIIGLVNNTSYMDFLAITAGMNLAQNDAARRLKMAMYLITKDFTSIPSQLITNLDQNISKLASTLWRM